MELREAMKALESCGTEQNRKVYKRHGVRGPQFGVSYANLGALTKKIKKDTTLAKELWATGNHDARILATMIADPEKLTSAEIDAWSKDLEDAVVAGAFSRLVGQSPHARAKAEKFRAAKSEWIASAGWMIGGVASAKNEMANDHYEEILKTIERDIHKSPNYVRYSMNNALIGIGTLNPHLSKLALAAAGRIGKVEVDHGETGCKTPDAAAYIKKTLARKKKK